MHVALTQGSHGVAVITLGTAGTVWLVNPQSAPALLEALRAVAQQPDTRVLVLRSGGSSFCGGGDIKAIRDALPDPERLLGPLIDKFHECILALRRLPAVVLGSVRGAAGGGGFSVTMACDVLIAAETARFVAGYPALGT